ncbi:MAG: hypothetical protein KAJ16_13665 [Calditrichia bacterium]|nr:hypothetical protein [Calditrichia bacterium]
MIYKHQNDSIAKILVVFLLVCLTMMSCTSDSSGVSKMGLPKLTIENAVNALIEKNGETARRQIEIGVNQVAARWNSNDGTADDFKEFCLKYFITDETDRKALFTRLQKNQEVYLGHIHQISRQFRWALDVDRGEVYPIDYLYASLDPEAHVKADAFNMKIAFVALLNYSLEPLETKNSAGMDWDREKWAEIRLAEEFMTRLPSELAQQKTETYTMADDYIANYNIYMNQLLDDEGKRLFPEDLKLISHWGLRDELKAQYANKDGFARQEMIQKVMQRIILQEIPENVINSEKYDWNPFTNVVYEPGSNTTISSRSEPNTRYQHILNIYQAEKMIDPYHPHAPSLIDRRFKIKRELLEQEVEELLTSVTSAPTLKEIAILIQDRLGRPLEPFDIWYTGFKPRTEYSEELLDQKVGKLYPDVESFQKDIPYILRRIGFSPQKAEFLAQHIAVDPSRGAGHAMGAMMREDRAHLRTRIPEGGMKYKGYNIAIHELGHNVEQVFSLNGIDYYSLNGVPNTAFTEAFAFVFQSRDMDILGISSNDQQAEDLRALNDMWATFEISGVALTDMYIWRWMYENPNADAEQVKQAMLEITKSVWNNYFAPLLGVNDQILLAVYSHIVDGGMYTPDYPLGHIISFQIEEYLKDLALATEMERMCKLGRLSPQIWMQQAVGEKISVTPMIHAAELAVKNLK